MPRGRAREVSTVRDPARGAPVTGSPAIAQQMVGVSDQLPVRTSTWWCCRRGLRSPFHGLPDDGKHWNQGWRPCLSHGETPSFSGNPIKAPLVHGLGRRVSGKEQMIWKERHGPGSAASPRDPRKDHKHHDHPLPHVLTYICTYIVHAEKGGFFYIHTCIQHAGHACLRIVSMSFPPTGDQGGTFAGSQGGGFVATARLMTLPPTPSLLQGSQPPHAGYDAPFSLWLPCETGAGGSSLGSGRGCNGSPPGACIGRVSLPWNLTTTSQAPHVESNPGTGGRQCINHQRGTPTHTQRDASRLSTRPVPA